MGRKIGGASSVEVTVPVSTTIEQDQFYLLDGFFGKSVQAVTTDAETTAEVILDIEQAEFETSQITEADAFAKGDKVYWNNATGLLTTQANPDANGNPQNRVVGRVSVAKDANNVIWFILGPQVQAHG